MSGPEISDPEMSIPETSYDDCQYCANKDMRINQENADCLKIV
jgi:hypothetical protein